MYIKHLTRNELLGFLKEEYKHTKIEELDLSRNEAEDITIFNIKLTSPRGDIFKFKVFFSDFKCEMFELVGGKSFREFTTKWMDWVLSSLKAKENSSNYNLLSKKYADSCTSLKQLKFKKSKAKTKAQIYTI